jgi:hypothetical protein
MNGTDFQKLEATRLREFKTWSAHEQEKLLKGNIAELEAAIANGQIENLTPDDRIKLIAGFAQRCRNEIRTELPPSEPVIPKRQYRRVTPIAKAHLPASIAKPIAGLSFTFALSWAVANWVVYIGCGLLLAAFING